MAQKNSTKTATKEARTASEPKIQSFTGWTGINIQQSPLGWNPIDDDNNQSDLDDNYLVVQNNIITTDNKTLETRDDDIELGPPPTGLEYTGVICLQTNRLISAFSDNSLKFKLLGEDTWTNIPITDPDSGQSRTWTYIGYYQSQLICFTDGSEIFTGPLSTLSTTGVSSARRIPNPTTLPTLTPRGSLAVGNVTRMSVSYVYTNRFGATLPTGWQTQTYNMSPVEFSAAAFLQISGNAPTGYDITGVDIYYRQDENLDAIFIGHVNLNNGGAWSYNWLGAMADTSVWTNVSLTIPTENTTKGVNASYFRHHDGRLYFWGGDDVERLYIGGNPGNELSVATGTGGAFLDIEPGSGSEIRGVHKFKTYNAASIMTVLCSNPNTGSLKRFNILETNITVTNELTSKGYMHEEVPNVVGCNSHWGSGVWADGLYAINRYGLVVTTQAMEYSNQLRVQYVSDQIEPVFSGRMSNRLSNARMICVKDIIYLVLAQEDSDDLDNVILCYDINLKAWYTFTYEGDDKILHVFNIDSEDFREGIGIVTPNNIVLIPITGEIDLSPSQYEFVIETGEMSIKKPLSLYSHVEQLQFRFDFFIGDIDITVDGVDYYGREVTFTKHIHHDTLVRRLTEYLRIGYKLESYRVTIRGRARMRLTHFLANVYQLSTKVGLPYGYDGRSSYANRDGGTNEIHHAIRSYNNLREAIIP